MAVTLSPEQLRRDLEIRDLTEPAAGPHAIQMLIDRAVDVLEAAWDCRVRRCSGPPVVDVADNYDNLGFSSDAASRDARFTRYLDDRRMLRSHASAMVPPVLRLLAPGPSDPVLLVCAGMVYRRDAIDRLHTGTPHQLDLWLVQPRRHTLPAVDEMVGLLIDALLPDRRRRTEPRSHPYTLDGRQIDIDQDGTWVEVGECGVAHPDVLHRAGLRACDGLALGLGLDRLLMVRKRIPDIRLLRSSDRRVAMQMLDLEPYRAVSALPSVVRDLSVAVPTEHRAEELGDRVRDALGHDADVVEEVAVVSETAYQDLPPSAVRRMGMHAGLKNVLVRVVLRPLDRTLTDREANLLRDRVYDAVHQGASHEWSSRLAVGSTRAGQA